MSKINDITKYKAAKDLVKDIPEILAIVYKFYNELRKYDKYIPIKKVLILLLDVKTVLEIHLKTQNNIVNNKGLIEEENNGNS